MGKERNRESVQENRGKEAAQKALDNHPRATKAYLNAEGEWHFSTPPKGFEVVETITKQN